MLLLFEVIPLTFFVHKEVPTSLALIWYVKAFDVASQFNFALVLVILFVNNPTGIAQGSKVVTLVPATKAELFIPDARQTLFTCHSYVVDALKPPNTTLILFYKEKNSKSQRYIF